MLNSMVPTSKDNRRSLYEFNYPVTKLVVVEEDSILGQHYHKNKDESFILLSGEATAKIGDKEFEMEIMKEVIVERDTVHTFNIKKGSILLGFATKEYDPNDEHKV